MILYNTPELREWLEERIRTTLHPETVFIGHRKNGKLVAAVGFSHYVPDNDIELSVASDKGGGSRALIAAVFQYVFEQSRCRRCTIRTRPDNEPAIKLATRFGFKHEGTLRQGFPDADALIFGLLRDEYGIRR